MYSNCKTGILKKKNYGKKWLYIMMAVNQVIGVTRAEGWFTSCRRVKVTCVTHLKE